MGKKMDDEYQNFLAELGGIIPESATKQTSTLAFGSGSSRSNPSWFNNSGSIGGAPQAGLGANPLKKEIDDTNLYIDYLPPTFDDDGLIQLFQQFGEIVMVKVIKDRTTGLSKGYGFVNYADVQTANNAIMLMFRPIAEHWKCALGHKSSIRPSVSSAAADSEYENFMGEMK